MRVLLVGNYPPPFGGISVHVQLLQRMLLRKGIDSKVLNLDPKAQESEEYIRVVGYFDFFLKLIQACRGRIIHLHTNGHNNKSWIIALACSWIGLLVGRGSLFTIHSGMAPEYLAQSGILRRLLVRLALLPQSMVVCVNGQIRSALGRLGFDLRKTLMMPAFLFDEQEMEQLDAVLERELSRFKPLLSLVAFFREEYGVEFMIEALGRLAEQYPNIGCVVMGSGEGERKLRRLAAKKGIAERMIWLGDLNHGECLNVIKQSAIFVRPTLIDGDSVSVREALKLGVPVVASDVGYRPPEVLLFNRADVEDLVTKCAAALSGAASAGQKQSTDSNSILPLLKVYKTIFGLGVEDFSSSNQQLNTSQSAIRNPQSKI
jgi:glycogen synthase